MRRLRMWWPRTAWWWVVMLLPSAFLIYVVPILVDGKAISDRLLASLPAVVAFVLPIWFSMDLAKRDRLERARAELAEVISPLRSNRPNPTNRSSILALLQADHCTSSFYGRRDVIQRLDSWLDCSRAPVIVVDGPALAGKKRCAIEWAERRATDWAVGWMRRGRGADAFRRILACGDKTIVLIDGYRSDLPDLLDRLAAANGSAPAVRVLLTTRDAGGIVARLARVSMTAAALVDQAETIMLGPIGTRSDHERWYEDFYRYYSSKIDASSPSIRTSQPPEWNTPPIGLLHAAALAAAVNREAVPVAHLDMTRVLDLLWQAEVNAWSEERDDQEWGLRNLSDSALEHAVVLLTHTAPADLDVAEESLAQLRDLRDENAGKLRSIVRWASQRYPSELGSTSSRCDVRPHLIPIAALVRLSSNDRSLAKALTHDGEDASNRELISRLVNATEFVPGAVSLIVRIIYDQPASLSTIIDEAALNTPRNYSLDVALATAVADCALESETVEKLLDLLPEYTLLRTKLQLSERNVAQVRQRRQDPESERASLAGALHTYSVLLGELSGREQDALAASTEVLDLYRRATEVEPDSHKPSLALALMNQAVRLGWAGHPSKSRSVGHEGISVYRDLARADPGQYEPDLALALTNHSAQLSSVGGLETEALCVSDEAVALYRRLVRVDPDRHEMGLAIALTNHVKHLGAMGDRDTDAFKVGDEAVTIYRKLAESGTATHEHDLAIALSNHAVSLTDMDGYTDEAAHAFLEALAILRRLSATHDLAYAFTLRTALHNYARFLGSTGSRDADACAATQEGLAIARRLFYLNPERYEPELASALSEHAIRLRNVRRHRDALTVNREAVTVYRRLSDACPLRYDAELAGALHNLMAFLCDVDPAIPEALKSSEEAVDIYRRLADANPARYDADLAMALHGQSVLLREIQELTKATTVAIDALDVYTRLAERNPEQWLRPRREELAYVRGLLDEQGRTQEAITFRLR